MKPAIMSWSSGKDSALALHRIRQTQEYEIVQLVTTLTEEFGRVSMHGVREELLDRQAEAIGIPLTKIRIPNPCSNTLYEAKMTDFLAAWQAQGVRHVVFGDLFLQDVRSYREQQLHRMKLEGVFPLWQEDTRRLAEEMIDIGLCATITCVDTRQMNARFSGRTFDRSLLRELAAGIDPCGENGEFHSFVHGGPPLSTNIPVEVGETQIRSGFAFTDLIPAQDLNG